MALLVPESRRTSQVGLVGALTEELHRDCWIRDLSQRGESAVDVDSAEGRLLRF